MAKNLTRFYFAAEYETNNSINPRIIDIYYNHISITKSYYDQFEILLKNKLPPEIIKMFDKKIKFFIKKEKK